MLATVLLVGAAIGIVLHWIECMIRPSLYARKLRWIVMIRIPEGIIVAGALRVLNLL